MILFGGYPSGFIFMTAGLAAWSVGVATLLTSAIHRMVRVEHGPRMTPMTRIYTDLIGANPCPPWDRGRCSTSFWGHNGSGPADEHDEGRLKSVLGVEVVPEDPLADAAHR